MSPAHCNDPDFWHPDTVAFDGFRQWLLPGRGPNREVGAAAVTPSAKAGSPTRLKAWSPKTDPIVRRMKRSARSLAA